MIGKTWEEGGKGALLGAGLGAAVPGAPCGGMGRGEGGSALQWPLPHSQGALLQRQRSLTQTSGASAPLWETLTTSTATLPTVINQATTPSLWDSSKKITTGSCSTLRHHTHPTLPGAQHFGLMRAGREATGLCTDSPCAASTWVCCCKINTWYCPFPSLPPKEWGPSADFTCLAPVGGSQQQVVAQLRCSLEGGWCTVLQGTPTELCPTLALLSLSLSWATLRWGQLRCSVALGQDHACRADPRKVHHRDCWRLLL